MKNETPKPCILCEGSGLEGGENMFNDCCELCDGSGYFKISKNWKDKLRAIFGGQTTQLDP